MQTQQRGQLTDRIKTKSIELFGYEIDQTELRLLPFIQYTLCNSQKLDNQSINNEERDILIRYVKNGWIANGITSEKGRPMLNEKLKVTKEFWDSICEIVWLGYVDLFDVEP